MIFRCSMFRSQVVLAERIVMIWLVAIEAAFLIAEISSESTSGWRKVSSTSLQKEIESGDVSRPMRKMNSRITCGMSFVLIVFSAKYLFLLNVSTDVVQYFFTKLEPNKKTIAEISKFAGRVRSSLAAFAVSGIT